MSWIRQQSRDAACSRDLWVKQFAPHPYRAATLAQQCGEGSFCPYPRFYRPSRAECVRLIQRIDPSYK